MGSFVKKIALTVLLISYAWVHAQNEVAFDGGNFQSVLQRSKATHKPIFYMLYASWCTHCNKMKAEVFKDAKVANYLNANFICAAQDAEKGEGILMKQQFRIIAYPTFLFFDENGELLYAFNGEFQPEAFLTEVRIAQTPERQLPYLEKQFNDDPSNGQKCLDYLTTLKKGFERFEINTHAQKYFATQTDEQLVSETNWRIIANGVSDIESRPFQYVLKHKSEFEKVASPKRVQKKIDNIVMEMLQPYTESSDTVAYFNKRAIAKSVNTSKTDSIIFRYDLHLAEKTKNWKWYDRTARELAEKYAWNDANLLKEIGQNYASNMTKASDLNFAIPLVARSLQKNETYEAAIVLARLYQRRNDSKQALIYAERAKKRNGDLGFNTKEADELIAQLNNK